jgi:hypothetical protein
MPLRHILEYEDHEIQDLLGDLETVGHVDKKTFALWVSLPRYRPVNSVEPVRMWGDTFMIALGHPFYSSGSLELDKPLILEALKQGEFTGGSQDDRVYNSVVEFLESPSLIQFFSDQKTLDESLLNLKKRLAELILIYDQGEPTVGIVYGRPGDRDLEIEPLSSFRMASFDKRGPVFYEDLDSSDNHWTFPFS